jgi:ParB family chromosome partitioning protein
MADLSGFKPRGVRIPEQLSEGVQVPMAVKAAIDLFEEDPKNSRTRFDPKADSKLAKDIQKKGLAQPLQVIPIDGGKFRLVSGARRLRAARVAGLTTLPYIIAEPILATKRTAQLTENNLREETPAMDMAREVDELLKSGEFPSKQDLAEELGLHSSELSWYISLSTAPAFILNLYESRKCTNARYLYELRNSWDRIPEIVEKRVAAVDEITNSFLHALKETLKLSGKKRPSKKSTRGKQESSKVSARFSNKPFALADKEYTLIAGSVRVRDSAGKDHRFSGDRLAKLLHAAAADSED